MTDTALQRTLRRGIALLVLPLSALVFGMGQWVWSDIYGATPPGAFGRLAVELVPPLLFVGAFGYLLASGAYGLMHRMSPERGGEDGA